MTNVSFDHISNVEHLTFVGLLHFLPWDLKILS